MPVQLTMEETKFILERGLPEDTNEMIALLWEYWSSTDNLMANSIERAKEIRKNGYLFERL